MKYLIQPFPGLRPTKEYVADVIAPPYDVLSSAEARIRAKNKPYSFLHISKPEIDLPENIDIYNNVVYAKGKENFQRLRDKKILQQDPVPFYYLYRLTMNNHQQLGLVAGVSVIAYQNNRVRKHELTRPIKEQDRVKQIQALQAQTGPVLLTYRHEKTISNLLKPLTQTQPEFDVVADDGIRHELWLIKNHELITKITQQFEQVDYLYIADGHHRSAAAAQVAELEKTAASQYFLAVIFPDNELQIMSYHRVIKDLNGLSTDEFLNALNKNFTISKTNHSFQPTDNNNFGMYLNKQWYQLVLKSKEKSKSPVDHLAVSILAHHLIEPILNIHDPRKDERIDFIGGIRGLPELERRVDSKEMAVAFSVPITTFEELFAVVNQNEIMPPKSTWFEPKLADGLVSYLLD